ncbi:uncharacterized protein ASCRUDRAFT_73271 [Ascoidea rubescens DSM 1968]|uniref:Chloride channel protein n=1 Tax=Ascoidea rubescens DSM 1968 TaxID=1344418 RepID=A0A1D2VP53_9ASCO|nr:hypothetical protein ASCRUDRAFT_73271 [Ascoidea rubescens DSM 1968]ODV63402.1 hypothetical protein ASCRUDRAFT_73271 [Ascoidea rubescens DSM 1968]
MNQTAHIPFVSYRKRGPSEGSTSKYTFFSKNKHYENYSQIDWPYEYQSQRYIAQSSPGSKSLFNRIEKWLIIFLAGTLIGIITSCIDLSSKWVYDIRTGYCKDGFYLTKSNCCLGFALDECTSWNNWNEYLRLSNSSFLSYLINFSIYIVTSIFLCSTAVILVNKAPFSIKSGLIEIKLILSGLILKKFLSLKVLLIKSIGLILVVGSGLWIGKEGPLVHISCCIIHAILDFFLLLKNNSYTKNEALKRSLLPASIAAGIAVAFNAPIGGVLFTLEQFNSSFLNIDKLMWNCFVCATIATIILQLLYPFKEGNNVLFVVNMEVNWFGFELIPFVILGILGGIYGFIFSKLNNFFAKLRNRFVGNNFNKKIFEIFCLSIFTSIVTYPLIFAKLPLSTLIMRLFTECDNNTLNSTSSIIFHDLCSIKDDDITNFQSKAFILLILTAIQGLILTAYSFGSYIPGGILMPSLAIGACIGRSMGIFMKYIQINHSDWAIFSECALIDNHNYSNISSFTKTLDSITSFFGSIVGATNDTDQSPKTILVSQCIITGAYAVIGAAAFLTGVTKLTVSIVVIVFELTGAITYVLPIMISVLVSRYVNDLLINKSCYDLWIEFNKFDNIHINENAATNNLKSISLISAEDIMIQLKDLCYIYADDYLIHFCSQVLKNNEIITDNENRSSGNSIEERLTLKSLIKLIELTDPFPKRLTNEQKDFISYSYHYSNSYLQSSRNVYYNSYLKNIDGFPILKSKKEPILIGWFSKTELKNELEKIQNDIKTIDYSLLVKLVGERDNNIINNQENSNENDNITATTTITNNNSNKKKDSNDNLNEITIGSIHDSNNEVDVMDLNMNNISLIDEDSGLISSIDYEENEANKMSVKDKDKDSNCIGTFENIGDIENIDNTENVENSVKYPLYHLVESINSIIVLSSKVSLLVIIEFFKKMNLNNILLIDNMGRINGIVKKNTIVKYIELDSKLNGVIDKRIIANEVNNLNGNDNLINNSNDSNGNTTSINNNIRYNEGPTSFLGDINELDIGVFLDDESASSYTR